ncbi:MAG: hypothetical protein K9J16_00100 [Melioribacteraceae bacterium]|nr:hypothetical protein [Melioribacteraceae bacterium]MCF8353910.1 hypothetical protein [Melioribacteraceae bacterium]MCF8392667.1 hypothetical protein [Melioribacteraceae bacterium]MCF8417688.1 hypothetical protein [Melioribacteraceae bacterium]
MPNKFENPKYNSLKIGAEIINYLNQGNDDINTLYGFFEEIISPDKFFDILVFLYLLGEVDFLNNKLVLINEIS